MAPSRTSQHGVTGAVEVEWMESYLLPLSFSQLFCLPPSPVSLPLLYLSHPPSLSAFSLSLSTAYWAAVWNKVWGTDQRLPVPTAQRPPPTCQRRHPTPSQTRPSRPCLQLRPSPPTPTTLGRTTSRSPSSSLAPPSQPHGRWVERLCCGATVSREVRYEPVHPLCFSHTNWRASFQYARRTFTFLWSLLPFLRCLSLAAHLHFGCVPALFLFY